MKKEIYLIMMKEEIENFYFIKERYKKEVKQSIKKDIH